jgi:hypothetical protein
MQINRQHPDQKMSVASHYRGACCPFHANSHRHGNRRGTKSQNNNGLADKRRKARKAKKVIQFEQERWG